MARKDQTPDGHERKAKAAVIRDQASDGTVSGWDVLSAAARLTRQGDRARLDAELATALDNLWHPQRVDLYQLVPSQIPLCRRLITLQFGVTQQNVNLTPEHDEPLCRIDGAEQALAARRATVTINPATGEAAGAPGTYSLTFPIWNKNRQAVRLLKVDSPRAALHQAERSIQALLDLYQNHLNLIEDSEMDALTGLRNRRTFDHLLLNLLAGAASVEQAPGGFRRAQRRHDDGNNWLAVLDIDRFKQINDRYGHLFGDEVLILVANLMNKSFRSHDPLFRFGGEEFVVVLCGVDASGATSALERFRNRLETQHFPQVGQITISTGFTRIREGELSSEVLNRADAALYYAKENGRNRTCCFESLVEDGLISPLQRSAGSGFELF